MKINFEQRLGKNIILSMVQKQPCSIRHIVHSCNSTSYEVVKCLSDMVRNGQILVKSINGQLIVASAD